MHTTSTFKQKLSQSRKNFIWAGLGFLGFSVFKWKTKISKPKTERLLTQDGQLIEVDVSHLSSKKRKATNEEVKHWIVN